MSKSKKTYKQDDSLSKNNGADVRYRKRLQEELEQRMLLEDALIEMTRENQINGLYEKPE